MNAPESSINVHYTAGLARLALSPGEEAEYAGQLDRILKYVGQLSEIDTTGIEPGTHDADAFDFTRADKSRDSQPLDKALLNAPRRSGDQFMVPKVVE
ncbi:MAG: Asp-tRNA(Asn)/Glu-tRNA(Gln) amidotransferase subunit GatC [Verrucomicrobiota bacterium]